MIPRILRACAALLLGFVAATGDASAQVRTIENVAYASWTSEGVAGEARSNRVSVAVLQSSQSLETFRFDPQGSPQIYPAAPSCGSATGAAEPVAVSAATQYRAGEVIYLDIAAAAANLDPAAIDSIAVRLTTSAGASLVLGVSETAADSGRFAVAVPTRQAIRNAPQADPCALSVAGGDRVSVSVLAVDGDAALFGVDIAILADPFGVVFDSETGEPVSGASVALVDAVTGQIATVFAEDGTTPWPSRVISGMPITDGAGNVYAMPPGRYWFPLTSLGRYRLQIEPPPPYSAPSLATPEQLARLTREDGRAFAISAASFGGEFALESVAPVEVDIPVDSDGAGLDLAMSVSRDRVQPGDAVIYSLVVNNPRPQERRDVVVTVDFPPDLRVRRETIRINGEVVPDGAARLSADGLQLELALDPLPALGSIRISYAAVVRADARPGQLASNAASRDGLGRQSRANAVVRVEGDRIAGRMTIIGRVTAGSCTSDAEARGIAGVRLVMEDGSFAVTDAEGRYHFDGVVPGTHVVQVARSTLPPGMQIVECGGSTRSAGSPASRFVIGQGGSLIRADFLVAAVATPVAPKLAYAAGLLEFPGPVSARPQQAQPASAGGQQDWLALGDGPDGWLSPAEDANPRVPAIKVAFRHRAGQTVRLFVDGQEVAQTAFDGTLETSDQSFAVSMWRGVPLADERTVLAAEVYNSLGGLNGRMEREVFFTSRPANVALVPEQSRLVADGVTRPVLVVRITDRNGRPVREGVSGNFVLSAPFESAAQIDLQQIRQLSGIGEASARWVIEGENGLARIELAPTMVSGQLRVSFDFSDENIRRRQELDAWVTPGDVEWTIVGLGEGTLGARTVADNMERGGDFDSDLGDRARLAVYAKGRVLGKYLVTLAYDSARQSDDQPLLGALDPYAYYTVYADSSQRRFDAATREKLYLRVETSTFFALYGDFQTGFDETQLGRYQRSATGVRAEARLGAVQAEAFAARIGSTFRRDEFQGNGLAGPYPLGSRDIVINSERVTIEVRDRFRSEVIVSARSLARFIDYTIDPLSGTITFSEPVLSRDSSLNPQIVIIEYETGQASGGAINAGARAVFTSEDGALSIGATAITDQGEGPRSNLGVADVRLELGNASEIRAELGASETQGEVQTAWLVEAQHQTGALDLVAYARSISGDYGIGQQSTGETGRRKLGIDARYLINDQLSALASLSQDDSLADSARRRVGQLQLAYRSPASDLQLGLAHFDDRRAGGERDTSTVLEAGGTQRLFANRLELSAAASLALDDPESIDLPARQRLGLRYAITPDVRLTGTYEIAKGEAIDARTFRAGLELTPWQGGSVATSIGQQSGTAGAGGGQFASVAVAQTIALSPQITISATLDGNRILGDAPASGDVVNPGQPPANGGPLSVERTLFEDFTAATLSGTWRAGQWTATGRGEYRAGQFADRKGLAFGIIRQIGEGRSLGGNFLWTRADGADGGSSAIIDAGLTLALRPAEIDWSLLGRIEYRSDSVTGALAGNLSPVGRTALMVTGDAVSRRLIGSLSANWSPGAGRNPGQLNEIGLFLGTRYGFDQVDGLDLEGLTALAGVDLRLGLNDWLDLGGSASIRANVTDGSLSYAVGPQASFAVAQGALLSVGYNFAGFRDPDFSVDRALDQGVFAAIRFKFDAETLGVQAGKNGTRGDP